MFLDYHEHWWFYWPTAFAATRPVISFFISFSASICHKEKVKRFTLEHQKQPDLKNVTLKINDKTRTGFKSTFFFLLCLTKLFEFEFELGIKCFQKKLIQNVTKKILTGIIFHRWTKQKKQRPQQQLVNISIGCIFLNNKYVFCVKKRNALFGHFSLGKSNIFAKKTSSDSMS